VESGGIKEVDVSWRGFERGAVWGGVFPSPFGEDD